MRIVTLLLFVVMLILSLSSCEQEINSHKVLRLPDTLYNYSNVDFPEHFSERVNGGLFEISPFDNDNLPSDNPITNEGATLGRVLFYDENLSKNRTISCASCHQQAFSFSDGKTFSIGLNDELTPRNSPSLVNNRFYVRKHYFMDERAETLEDLILQPFKDPVEMNMSEELLVARILEQPFYEDLFMDAFDDKTITTERISKAVAQFVRSLSSFNSKYDAGRSQVDHPINDFPNFTDEENLGKALFMRPQLVGANDAFSCLVCHASETFSLPMPVNNGLDSVFTDVGTYTTFPYIHFQGAFKTASLRNIELTAPYMHDGRFETLEEVIEHYNSGILFHQSLPFNLRIGNEPRRMNYTEEQKAALIAFLKTLTDEQFITDDKFSNPFF